jgi:hypothetical protein
MQYYPIQRRWRRIRPHLEDPELQRILARDMRKISARYRPGMKPVELDTAATGGTYSEIFVDK